MQNIYIHPTLLGEPAHLDNLEQHLGRPATVLNGKAVIELEDQPHHPKRQTINPVGWFIGGWQPTPPTAA